MNFSNLQTDQMTTILMNQTYQQTKDICVACHKCPQYQKRRVRLKFPNIWKQLLYAHKSQTI